MDPYRFAYSPILSRPKRIFERTPRNVSRGLRRVRQAHPGSVQASGRPAGLLQRLFQQPEIEASELVWNAPDWDSLSDRIGVQQLYRIGERT